MNKEELLKFLRKMRGEHYEAFMGTANEDVAELHHQSIVTYDFIISEIESGEFDNKEEK